MTGLAQHGHRGILLARATVSLQRMVGIELGKCRSGRVGAPLGRYDRERQVASGQRGHGVLRGEPSPSLRSGSHRRQYRGWYGDGSLANRGLRSGRDRPPASVPGNRALDEGVVAVEAGGLDQGEEDRPRPRPGLRSGEKGVAATGCDQAMEALDGVGVDLDPAVVEVGVLRPNRRNCSLSCWINML